MLGRIEIISYNNFKDSGSQLGVHRSLGRVHSRSKRMQGTYIFLWKCELSVSSMVKILDRVTSGCPIWKVENQWCKRIIADKLNRTYFLVYKQFFMFAKKPPQKTKQYIKSSWGAMCGYRESTSACLSLIIGPTGSVR